MPAAIAIHSNGRLNLNNSLISESGGYGMYVRFGELLSFSENSFENNSNAGLGVNLTEAVKIDGATTFTNNQHAVEIYGSGITESSETTLSKLDGTSAYYVSGNLSIEDIIAEEEMVVTITHKGYIKRLPSSTWRSQRRGGRGMKGAHTKEDDFIEHLFTASTHDTMMFFTDRGKCYWLKVHEIPPGQRTSQGRAVVNLIGCEPGEKVKAFVSVKEFNDIDYIAMSTRNGMIKRSPLSMYSRPRKGGIYAIEIREGDELIQAKISHGDQDIILATSNGKSIRFSENNVRPTGRKTMGVKGITLRSSDDWVIGMIVIKREGTILVASDKGLGKRTNVIEYRVQNRGGKGIITLKTTDKVGKMVSMIEVVDNDDLMIITDSGIMIRQPVENIRTIGRNTQGVRLIRLDDGATISSVTTK